MKTEKSLVFIIFLVSISIFLNSCNILPDLGLEDDFVLEDFETENGDNNLAFFSIGTPTGEIRTEGDNNYLYVNCPAGTGPEDRAVFTYDNMAYSLAGSYTIQFDILIESMDETAMIDIKLLTPTITYYPADFLKFFFFEGQLGCHHRQNRTHPTIIGDEPHYFDSPDWQNFGEWIHVVIDVDDLGIVEGDPMRNHTVQVGSSTRYERSEDCPILQNTFIEAHSGAVAFRIDNYRIDFN